MVIRRWTTFFFSMVLLPLLILAVNSSALFVILSLLILNVCVLSLKKIVILNFGSMETIERFCDSSHCVPKDEREVKLYQAEIFCLNVMVILYCSNGILYAPNIWFAIFAGFVTGCWVFDFVRTLLHFVKPVDLDEEYSFKDVLLEAFIWVHNIVTIILVVFMFGSRYFS